MEGLDLVELEAGCLPLPLVVETVAVEFEFEVEPPADLATGGDDSCCGARLYGGLGIFSGLRS